MTTIRKDVRDLISINERIQSSILNDETLTEEEAIIIRMCAVELLSNLPAQVHSFFSAQHDSLD